MFKKFKQKIAEGEEGVSPGKQTPLGARAAAKGSPTSESRNPTFGRGNDQSHKQVASPSTPTGVIGKKSRPQDVLARVHQLLEVGKAQAQNNGLLDQEDDVIGADHAAVDPLGIVSVDTSQVISSTPKPQDGKLVRSTSRDSNSSNPGTPSSIPSTPVRSNNRHVIPFGSLSTSRDERSDAESDMDQNDRLDHMSREELAVMYKKHERTLARYKTKFSEVVDAYKSLQKEKEKLENTLTSGQDKQLRRISELKETIDLEQKGKRHLEETLRLSLEEKDEVINVLSTQVNILKTQPGAMSPSSEKDSVISEDEIDASRDRESQVKLRELSDMKEVIDKQNEEIDTLKNQSNEAREVILRLEQEKKTAIQEMMESMHGAIVDKENIKTQVILLNEELLKRNDLLNKMKEEGDTMKERLTKELRDVILEEAIVSQEKEMQFIYKEKEETLKTAFADKIRDFQRLLEEKDRQKQDEIKSKDEEINKSKSKVSYLEESMKELTEREANLKAKVKKIVIERGDWERKFYESNQCTEQEQAKVKELVQQHNNQLTEKNEELQQQINKVKKSNHSKIQELEESNKKYEQKILEVQEQFSKDIQTKAKEAETQKQAEIGRVTRKFEAKQSEMKKMIKELRSTVTQKESTHADMESTLTDMGRKLMDTQRKEAEQKIELETVTKNNERIKNQLKEKESQLTLKETNLQNLQSEFERVTNDYDVKLKEQNNESLKLKLSLEESEATLQTNIDEKNNVLSFQSKIREIEKELKERNTELQKKTIEVSELHERLISSQSTMDDNVKQLTITFESDLSRIKQDYEQIKDKQLITITKDREKLENEHKVKVNNIDIERNSLKEALDREVSNRKEIEGKLENESKTVQSLQTECSTLKLSLESSEKSSNADRDKWITKINELEKNICEEQKMRESMSEKQLTIKKKLKTATSDLKNDDQRFREALLKKENEISQLNDNLKFARHQLLQEEKSFNDKLQSLQSQRKDSVDVMEREFEKKLTEKENGFRKQLNEIRHEKDLSVDDVTDKLIKDREERLHQLEKSYGSKIENLSKEWEIKMKSAEKERDITIVNVQKEKELAILGYTQQIKTLQEELQSLNESHKLSSEEGEARMQILLSDKEKLTETAEQSRNDLKSEKNSFDCKVQEMTKEHQSKLDTVKQQFEKNIDEMSQKHQHDLGENKNKMIEKEAELDELRIKHNEEMSNVQKEVVEGKNSLEEVNLALAKREQEFHISMHKKVEELTQNSHSVNSNFEEQIETLKLKHSKELEEKSSEWKKRCDDIERKLKRIIADKERKHRAAIDNLNKIHEEKCKEISVSYEDKLSEADERYKSYSDDQEKAVFELNKKMNTFKEKTSRSQKEHEEEVQYFKKKEKELISSVDVCKNELEQCQIKYQNTVKELQTELREFKAREEELTLQLNTGKNNNQEIDAKFHRLLQEKKELEDQLIEKEQKLHSKLKLMENDMKDKIKNIESNTQHREEELKLKVKEIEAENERRAEQQQLESDKHCKTKVLEMKRKAESKIANMKKQHTLQLEQKDNKITDLVKAVEDLREKSDKNSSKSERELEDLRLQYEGNMKQHRDHAENEMANQQSGFTSSVKEKELEIKNLNNKVQKLEEKIDYYVVEKMEALKTLRTDMEDEHKTIMEKAIKDTEKRFELSEKKLRAQVEDKEFEYSSRVKQIVKEFQSKLYDKEEEQQSLIDDANDAAQKEERQIINDFEDQIGEYKRELKLREDDMVDLKKYTDNKLKEADEQITEQQNKHKDEFDSLEQDFHARIQEIIKTQEEELKTLKLKHKSEIDRYDGQTNEIEKSYYAKLEQVETQHRHDKLAIEKKLKNQMKRNQIEMKKLLVEKGALQNQRLNKDGEDWELANHLANSNHSSDAEMDSSDVISLKDKVLNKELTTREGERCTQFQNRLTPQSSQANRPATLDISQDEANLTTSFSVPPRSPEPLEYEYLKNILFEYMMGRQRKQMAKVLAAIVHFTPSQTQQINEKEEQVDSQTERAKHWI